MKSISGMTWKMKSIPERLIHKKRQDLNTNYLLSKIFLDNKYSNEEIHNSLNKEQVGRISYIDADFGDACEIFLNCIKYKKKILIFGDYDVDGYSSTYLLYDFITSLKIQCDFYIPDRFKDGYGPNINLIKKIVDKNIYSLVFFVDCASNSSEEVNKLEKNGIKTIVIDHHQIYKNTDYKNTVIINPLKYYSKNQFSYLCATTLVFFFINYVNNKLKKKIVVNYNKYLFLSTVATICDQMPLRNLNRVIVKKGLKNYDSNKFLVFKKLLKLKNKISSADIGFNLGPLLNSPSRLGYPDLPINLLIESDNNNINQICERLIMLNEKRKKIQNKIFKLLNKKINIINNEIIFIYEDNINEGLLGIISAKFVEIYGKPCFILTKSNDQVKCSSRSIYGFDIGKIFNTALNKKIILKGGGHSMAGGCILRKNKINQFKSY